jgi:RNA-directed DNA polymerase
LQPEDWKARRPLVNTGAPWPGFDEARARVLGIQVKLHRWAAGEPGRRFDDLFNLVTDPAFLMMAWERVRANRGARTAGVDGATAYYIREVRGEGAFLAQLRADLKAGVFVPLPVRERMIPKAGGRLRRLGIPTVRDRVVQAALKLVLEPVFEADFQPFSYGFRPRRRAQDAIAEIHQLYTWHYDWVLEADIEACFDSIDHVALLGQVRRRIGDKRVLALVKAFLKAGILTVDGTETGTVTGTPQGGILSPLLANIALSVLDDHFAGKWRATGTSTRRRGIRKRGGATCRLVRYADDFVVMVYGTREHAEALRSEVAGVLAPLGLRLASAKTQVVHLDEGFDFLGWHIQRRRKRGTSQHFLYTYPSKKALLSVMRKVRALTRRSKNRMLADLLHRLNPVLRGWAAYFRHGVSKRTFAYLGEFAWHRVIGWLRKRHPGLSWARLRRRYLHGWQPAQNGVTLFNPATVTVTRYRYRGTRIPDPWPVPTASTPT